MSAFRQLKRPETKIISTLVKQMCGREKRDTTLVHIANIDFGFGLVKTKQSRFTLKCKDTFHDDSTLNSRFAVFFRVFFFVLHEHIYQVEMPLTKGKCTKMKTKTANLNAIPHFECVYFYKRVTVSPCTNLFHSV